MNIVSEFLDCLNMEEKKEFCLKYEWLIAENEKLGCSVCREIWTLGVNQKVGMEILDNDNYLRLENIFEYKESESHKTSKDSK